MVARWAASGAMALTGRADAAALGPPDGLVPGLDRLARPFPDLDPLSLLAERAALADERGTPPLMLLDDVMSELDAGRRERLVEVLGTGGQSVLTTTELAHVPGAQSPGVVRLLVTEGTVTEVALAPVARDAA